MPSITRRSLVAAGLAGAPLMALGQGSWPSERPISFIVPFPPGGGTDVMARAMVLTSPDRVVRAEF
jgi:tripartite-type tricarboxylate transporter receptor subunit TctC